MHFTFHSNSVSVFGLNCRYERTWNKARKIKSEPHFVFRHKSRFSFQAGKQQVASIVLSVLDYGGNIYKCSWSPLSVVHWHIFNYKSLLGHLPSHLQSHINNQPTTNYSLGSQDQFPISVKTELGNRPFGSRPLQPGTRFRVSCVLDSTSLSTHLSHC